MYSFVDALTPSISLTSTIQILLLEDDPVDCELVKTTLINGGIEGQFVEVSSRQAFMEGLEKATPRLILADYVLPKFDGLAALKAAQEICPDVPFILVSGVLGEEQAIEAMKQGATDYVLKRRLERLVPAVRRALRESQERQERQRVERALKQTDDLLRTIVDESPIAIVTLNRAQRVVTWNPVAAQSYGWSADAVVDRPLPLIPELQREAFDFCFHQALQGSVISNYECQHQKQNGQLVDVSLSLAPLHDAKDVVYGAVMVAVDITARKQIEARQLNLLVQESAARAAAESSNRLKDEFLAVLSHELRTPLNAIVGWAKLIKRGKLRPAVNQKAVDTIERNAIAQTQLIEDLLDLSRIMQGQMNLNIKPTNINTLIRAAVDTLRPAIATKSINLNLSLEAQSDSVLADCSRMQQILWNLIANAVKFTPASGTVTIRSEHVDDCLHIQVTDSGIGIAPDFLPHVFDYFRQADGSATRTHGGMGLGLAIARSLVELHGGSIDVKSPGLNQGAIFTVKLPLRMTQADSQSAQSSLQEAPALDGIKVMIVDDEDDSRELLIVVLEQEGAQVESAESVLAAFSCLETFQPDLIISDIGMPVTDGYDFLNIIRSMPDSQLSTVPAIALTAYARDEDHQLALQAGYQAHIAKPFDITEISKVVYQLTRPADQAN